MRDDARAASRRAPRDDASTRTSELPFHVLGLDPGSRFTGWGCIALEGSRSRFLGCGRIALPTQEPLASRLAMLTLELEALLERWQPAAAAIEDAFHGANSRSLIVLAQARGALLATLARSAVPVAEYAPAEVKSAITGNGRADKAQVARMVAMLLPAARNVAADAADALAVALTHAARRPLERAAAIAADRP